MSTRSLTSVTSHRLPVSIGLFLGTVLLAIFFGLIAATGSPIFAGLAAGLLIGALLLAKASWNIWLILALGLTVAGLIPIWADGLASKAVWGISLLGFILMISALFRMITNPGAARDTPAFVWMALIFMLYAVFNSLIQWSSLGEFVGGFKRYFQVFGLLFALTWLAISENDIRRWRKLFVIVALLQLPFAAYELISLVPLRESLSLRLPWHGTNRCSGGNIWRPSLFGRRQRRDGYISHYRFSLFARAPSRKGAKGTRSALPGSDCTGSAVHG